MAFYRKYQFLLQLHPQRGLNHQPSATGLVVLTTEPTEHLISRVYDNGSYKLKELDETDIDIRMPSFLARHEYILSLFDGIAEKYTVRFIWPHTVLCHENVCPIMDDGRPIYFDHNHLSIFGATKTSFLYDVIFAAASVGAK